MTKKNIILTTAFLILVGSIYFYLYRDYFGTPDIQILHTIRPRPTGRQRGNPSLAGEDTNVLTFGLGREYKLTSVQVFVASERQTNKYPHPIWDLTTTSNSAPTRAFSYGSHIRGLHPTVKGAQPDPLVPNVDYQLVVKAGNLKGEHIFKIPGEQPSAQ